ncbi:unnamed protein product [Linum trigynum]|uniref:Uncharacterized protein n=1 Tax=Linum trigynum TaxID=586398 RepID=A0AAV2FU24_9ROSI
MSTLISWFARSAQKTWHHHPLLRLSVQGSLSANPTTDLPQLSCSLLKIRPTVISTSLFIPFAALGQGLAIFS